MFMRTLTAATLLATVLPSAMAAQTTITTTTQGVIKSSSWKFYTDIQPGETFELTTVMRFDPTWIEQTGPGSQRVRGSAYYTFKVADRTYQFSSSENWATMDFELRKSPTGGDLSMVADLSNHRDWAYRLIYVIDWTANTYAPPPNLFTSDTYEYTYAAPFENFLYFREFVFPSEPTGDIATVVTSTHIAVTTVPEPATYAMLGAGLGLIALSRRKRRTEPETSPA